MIIFLSGTLLGMLISKGLDLICRDNLHKEVKRLGLKGELPSIQEISKDYRQLNKIIDQTKHMIQSSNYPGYIVYDSVSLDREMRKNVEPLLNQIQEKLFVHELNIESILKIYDRLLKNKREISKQP
jgi:hypothetical protein